MTPTNPPNTDTLKKFLADFGRAYHKAMPSAVGGNRELRKAVAEMEALIASSIPEKRQWIMKEGADINLAHESIGYNIATKDFEDNLRKRGLIN